MRTIEFETSAVRQAIDVTEDVARAASRDGFIWVATPHTTASLILSEVDDDLLRDIESVAAGLLQPFEPFLHRKNNNPNAAAHIFSSLMGSTLLLRVHDGSLDLGPYQRVVLIELDGPKTRSIRVEDVAG